MKKWGLLAFLVGLIFIRPTSVSAQYGKDFYLQPYTINSPVSSRETMVKIDYDPAVVNIKYGYIAGAELDFSVRHASGARATYGFTAGGNYRHTTDYMPGQAKMSGVYRLYSSFYDPRKIAQGTATAGRWAP